MLRAALLLAATPALFRASWHQPRFVLPPKSGNESAVFFQNEFLPATATAFVHGPSLAELPNGDLIAAWYGGSDETRRDVWIYSSIRDRTGRWSTPQKVEDGRNTEDAIEVGIKSVGNPVLFADDRGVTLFYVAIPFGGWSTGTICMTTSRDGVRWSRPRRLAASPFLNLGVLVRGRPLPYADGTLAVPMYFQLGRKGSGVLHVTRDGDVLDESRLEDSRPLIQPWMIPTSADRAIALLRWSSQMPGCVRMVAMSRGGAEWSSVFGTPLVHRDSAIAGESLNDGSLLVAYNNTAWDRRDLSISRTPDAGWHWSKPHPIERDTTPDWNVRREYSYPYFYRSRDGLIHLLYSWRRSRIRHLIFNDAWAISR